MICAHAGHNFRAKCKLTCIEMVKEIEYNLHYASTIAGVYQKSLSTLGHSAFSVNLIVYPTFSL